MLVLSFPDFHDLLQVAMHEEDIQQNIFVVGVGCRVPEAVLQPKRVFLQGVRFLVFFRRGFQFLVCRLAAGSHFSYVFGSAQ